MAIWATPVTAGLGFGQLLARLRKLATSCMVDLFTHLRKYASACICAVGLVVLTLAAYLSLQVA
jgi:hypothetical protein